MDKAARYNTKQRDRIMEYLKKKQNEHITVEQLIDDFKEEGISIGISTVYRYLDVLVKEGTVRKFTIEEGCPACFQYFESQNACKEHFHLKCNCCGALYHIESEHLTKAQAEVFRTFGFRVDPSKTVIYGECRKCSKEGTV